MMFVEPELLSPISTSGFAMLAFGDNSSGSTNIMAQNVLDDGSLGNPPCASDMGGNGTIDTNDVSAFFTIWFNSLSGGGLAGDFNQDNTVDTNDVSSFLNAWFSQLTSGC